MEPNLDNNLLKKNTLMYLLVLVVVLLLAIVFVVFKFDLAQNLYQSKLPSWMPQDLLPPNTQLKDYKVNDPASFLLRKGEEYQVGGSYEVNKPYKEMVGEIILIMSKDGWVPIDGTKQDEKQTVLKMNNGQQTVFVAVKKIDDQKSMVIFTPVERTANK